MGGPGFIRGTHTAWRAGKYVFVGDEVFSATPRADRGRRRGGSGPGLRPAPRGRCLRSRRPEEVAYYEPKDGGTHNVWVAGDTLYLGDYQGGLRVLDISGELRGDLLRQGREIAHVVTGDSAGRGPQRAQCLGSHLPERPDLRARHQLRAVDREGGGRKSELVP